MSKSKFEWTENKTKYLTENWGKESAHSMKKRFGTTWYTVAKKAAELGLEPPKDNEWSDEDVITLRELAEGNDLYEIAEIMEKTTNAIYLKARKLKIVLIQKRRKWTVEEEEYLKENWGLITIETVAKNLKRTVLSIKVKATRMKLGSMISANTDELKVSEISELLNVRGERITDTWYKHGLRLKKKKITKKHGYYCVSIEDLMIFLRDHQSFWNSLYLEKNIFGEEPMWLLVKRERDRNHPPYEYRTWTKEELEIVKRRLLDGFDYEEISNRINRSEKSIGYKIRSLGLQYQLKKYWKGKEFLLLKTNYKIKTQKELALLLNRTPKAIGAKAEELGLQKRKLKNKTQQSL